MLADRDVMLAQKQLANRRLLITGKVQRKRLGELERREAQFNPFSYSASLQSHREQIPVVVLGETGRVHCFFAPKHFNEIAEIPVGTEVTFDCVFDRFWTGPDSGASIAVLGECQLAASGSATK